MRGEHRRSSMVSMLSRGSSPHARGARHAGRHTSRRAGIIPACAGSTSTCMFITSPARDHPRMRGEHHWLKTSEAGRLGSSPHARGALRANGAQCLHVGIIPACAGSTPRRVLRAEPGEDHPRMRGEHSVPYSYDTVAQGSSPHARGARAKIATRCPITGIIPACAGSTNEVIMRIMS